MTEITQENQNSYEISAVSPLGAVRISDAATGVLHQYTDIAHEQMTEIRAGRRVEILRDFAGVDVPDWAIEAAALADIAERAAMRDSVHKNSRRIMNRYILMRGDSPEQDEVIKTLASLSYVEKELGQKARSVRKLGSAVLAEPEEKFRKKPKRIRRQPKDIDNPWADDLEDVQLADPDKLFGLTDKKMLVPLLVWTTKILDGLKNRRELTKTEANTLVRDALEVSAPFCEIIGYDGLAHALSNAANGVRVENKKNYDEGVAATVTEKFQKMFVGDGHCEVIAKICDKGDLMIAPSVGDTSKAHETKLGSFLGTLGGVDVDGRYRVKGLYTLLYKYFSKNYEDHSKVLDELPMDTLGLTFVTKNHAESALLFGKMLERIQDGDDFILKPTTDRASKENGFIHIQGTEEFIDTICQENSLDKTKISYVVLPPEDYEVAKLTFLTRNGDEWIPTEVQFTTREARDRGRRGVVSHILYKLFGKLNGNDSEPEQEAERVAREKTATVIKAIHAQKKVMKQPIPISQEMIEFIDLCQRAGV